MKDEHDTMTGELFAERPGDAGMSKAIKSEDPEWVSAAIEAVRYLAASGRIFDSDDVLIKVGRLPQHRNAIGAVMRLMRKRMEIEPVGAKPSARTDRRGGMIRTWRRAE